MKKEIKKVECLSNKPIEISLWGPDGYTIGKVYEVVFETHVAYLIKNDDGIPYFCDKECFKIIK